jgi:hypothetical protein
MKKLVTLLFVSVSLLLNAQNYTISSYIGDDNDYTSSSYTYTYPSSNTNLSSVYNLPFTWEFYGQSVNSLRIAHDGYITFDLSNAPSVGANTSLPNSGGPNNAIYACWDDFTSDASISMQTYGKSPNRIHVIRWYSLNYSGAAQFNDDIYAQIKIYEDCKDFEVVIKDRDIATSSSFYSMINTTIGCENANGTVGVQIAGSPNYIPSAPSGIGDYEVHRFTWNGVITNDASLIAIQIGNHLTAGSYTLKGAVRNEGDAVLSNYDVNYTLNGGVTQTVTINEAPSVMSGDNDIIITTGSYAIEIFWDVTEDATGTIVAQGSGSTAVDDYDNNTVYIIGLCNIGPGNYTFNWHDIYGDGWNGGSYAVLDNNTGNNLTSGSPASGFTGSSSFYTSGSNCTLTTLPSTVQNSKISKWEHPIDIEINSSSDNYELKVWTSNVNGQNDEVNCNDTLIEYITGIENISSQKTVLIEEWTGAWCTYCYDGIVVLQDIANAYGNDVIITSTHDGDEMEFDNILRGSFSSSSYPTAVIDRQYFHNTEIYDKEAIGRGLWDYMVVQQLARFTPLSVDINHTWDPNTREIVADVSAIYTDNSAGDMRMVLMIVEDSMSGIGSGWDQSGSPFAPFYHRHVTRDYVEEDCYGVDNVIPNIVSSGASYTHQFTYTLPNDFNEDKISLVAAVVKYMEGNDAGYVGVRGNRNVYNAKEKHLYNVGTVSGTYDLENELRIYPNPTNSLVYFSENIDYKLYNVVGKLIKQGKGNSIDLSDLTNGIYILESKNNRVRIVKN